MSLYKLNDKVVIVTGAGSGSGEAIAIQFSKHGSFVVICDKDEVNASRVAALCDKSLIHVGDLTNDKVCEELIQKTLEKFGKIDVLVNNAGILTFCDVLDTDFLKNYDLLMNVNTRVPLKLSRLAMPHLLQSKGCIVNMSSIAAYTATGSEGGLHYSMSKAAQDAMTRNLAHKFGPQGVRVVAINPGWMKTNIHKAAGVPDTIYDDKSKNYPLRRPGEPSEIANAVCFAASNAASFITGVNLIVDGGYSLNN